MFTRAGAHQEQLRPGRRAQRRSGQHIGVHRWRELILRQRRYRVCVRDTMATYHGHSGSRWEPLTSQAVV